MAMWKKRLVTVFRNEIASSRIVTGTPYARTHISKRGSTSYKTKYDAIIIGAGHNGLTAACYLRKAGVKVCVLERRSLIGGAAVTEEIIPGFKFSRASYVLSLLRPQIIKDLELEKHGFKTLFRDPKSFTPWCQSDRTNYLTLGQNSDENAREIAKFSVKDAEAYAKYGHQMEKIVSALNHLIDTPPIDITFSELWQDRASLKALLSAGFQLGRDFSTFYEYLTSPAAKILNRWFESDLLKATLSTDAVIGALTSPLLPGSGYVLLHHVMGELDGKKGMWAYVKGGMGAVSESIASAARSLGAEIYTNSEVRQIVVDDNRVACGIVLQDGTHIQSELVLSNATAKVTFIDLIDENSLPQDFRAAVNSIDYTSPVTKINVAVKCIPNFRANPNKFGENPMPHHRGSIHLNCHSMAMIHDAYLDAINGSYSKRPLIEMTIPTSLDSTLAPSGCHVVQLFTQFTPYSFSDGSCWTDKKKNDYADLVFESIEQYAPGFTASVIGRDILTPPDLEKIFALTGGNIFHGAMSLDQLYFCRPAPAYAKYSTPVRGLFLCGSGAHPGGGVMGSAGRLAAHAALKTFRKS